MFVRGAGCQVCMLFETNKSLVCLEDTCLDFYVLFAVAGCREVIHVCVVWLRVCL